MKAVIIKGNPKFVENNRKADSFYKKLKTFLISLGYEVSLDKGEPYTEPIKADLWIGHSRGVDRLRFAPKHTKVIALGIEVGINHPKDTSLRAGDVPNKFHYILTEDMKKEIKKALGF